MQTIATSALQKSKKMPANADLLKTATYEITVKQLSPIPALYAVLSSKAICETDASPKQIQTR
jgi:hypothetical protein